jgi:RNA polymerase sigma factor (sigma-70 family)
MLAHNVKNVDSFRTTQWTIVVTAAGESSPAAREALSVLCERYWYPIYGYVRRRGYGPHDAEDLTQAFFGELLADGTLSRADPSRGKFRAFLLGVLRHFLSDHFDRVKAVKRGGRSTIVRLDVEGAENRLNLAADPSCSPERAFEREWVMTVLRESLERLRGEWVSDGEGELFAHLQPHLSGDDSRVSFTELAARLGTTAGAVRVALHRLRKRYAACVRQEVADTVGAASELDEEMNYLFEALRP